MKKQRTLMFRFVVAPVAAGALCVPAGAFAQNDEPNTGSSAPGARATPIGSMSAVGQAPRKPREGDATATATKPANGGQLDGKDKSFVMEAAKGGMMEVEMGKMAQSQGQSTEVKNIGKTMVTDHTNANNQLMAIASKRGVQLDKNVKMQKLNGSNFDQEYLDHMLKHHEKDIAAFESEAKNGMDPDLKSFASNTLPTLKKHLSMIKSAQRKMGKGMAKKSG